MAYTAAVTEVYGETPDPSVLEEIETRFKAQSECAEQHASAAEEIGMTDLAVQDWAEVRRHRAVAWCEAHALTPLTDAELSVWGAWLPTKYSSKKVRVPGGEQRQQWASYEYFEGVPADVRERIKKVLPIFSSLEIRTPEEQPRAVDPILLGHIDYPDGARDTVLLARWGESDAKLLSFEDIRAILAARTGLFRLMGNTMSVTQRVQLGTVGFVAGGVCGFLLGMLIGMLTGMVLGIAPMGVLLSTSVSVGILGGASIAPLALILDAMWVFLKKSRLRTANPNIANIV